ncbi:hypothetical protein BJX63DRAFT_428201 [Aspergillus granulosus]|uniref:Uncharacterized protein n=1 Tax=Aspergillus granulosus TaxID=176169 RepID=A0ABR4HY06_9EURO
MSDTKLMDIEPGGEQTQYEGIRLFTVTPEKATGQLDGIKLFTTFGTALICY